MQFKLNRSKLALRYMLVYRTSMIFIVLIYEFTGVYKELHVFYLTGKSINYKIKGLDG